MTIELPCFGIVIELGPESPDHPGAYQGGKITSDPDTILKEPLTDKDVKVYRSPGHKQDWLSCIKSRKDPICRAEVGARSVTVCHLGNLAYWNKRRLRFDPKTWQFVGDAEANTWLDRERRAPYLLPKI